MSKNSYGFCDRSGFRYPTSELVEQYINRKPTGLLVGKDWLDIDHEQLQIGDVDANDTQTLDNPRPDLSLAESRAMTAWKPVGNPGVTLMRGYVGRVTVSTS